LRLDKADSYNMRSGELKDFVWQLKELPTLPPIAIRLIDLAGNKDAGVREVARLIEADQAFSAKLLRIANSAYFGFSRRINTVERATALLGLDLVRSLALSIIVFEYFKIEGKRRFNLVDFWRHSAACAIASELLARRFRYPQPQEAFVAGLLHDLGKLVFFFWNQARYEDVVGKSNDNRLLLLRGEEIDLGMGHSQAGRLLMEHWRFPPSLVNAAWLHHQPLLQFGANPTEEVAFIVKAANSLCHLSRFGDSGNPVGDLDQASLQKATGLSASDLRHCATQVLKRLEELSSSFNWEGTTAELYVAAVSRANQELSRLNMELSTKNRRLETQQRLMAGVSRLHEALAGPVSPTRAVDLIAETLTQALSFSRLLIFMPVPQKGTIEVRIKGGPDEPVRPISLEDSAVETREGRLSAAERAMKRLADDPSVGEVLREIVRSTDLVLVPLEADGRVLAQLLVELAPEEGATRDTIEQVRSFASAAALLLHSLMLVDSLEQQSEDMAKMARQVEEVKTKLYHAERLASVGRLAAGAAHEINNPLTIISARAQLLLNVAKDEGERKALQVIVDQSSRISRIITDLMGLARPAEPRIENTDVRAVLEHTLSALEDRIRVTGVEVRRKYQSELPHIQADPRQLEQVFLNLIINALQAMPGGGALAIRLGVDSGKHLRIDFKDTGVGIPPENIKHIFDPFYTTKRVGEGTGLGLAICHSIVESHQGEIRVRSEPGQGTIFTILLPLQKSPAAFVSPVKPAKVAPLPEPDAPRKGSVLVIDDEEALRKVLAETLAGKGFEVDTAADGDEALRKLQRKSYQVALLDLRMPRKHGLEVLVTVKRTVPQMPVIVISGVADERELTTAKQAGAFACIKKPFEINTVLEAIAAATSP
jgi:signal transduction histidine kinase/HD-like signal output (HDOD) protein